MKAIVNAGPGRLEWTDCPIPVPQQGEVRIKTAACGICATDLEMIAGWSRTSFPAIPGHEWSGVIDAVGPGMDARLVGQSCVAENVLTDDGEVGFEHPGGYAEYFITEVKNIQLLPDDFPLLTAVLIEPLAVTVRALRRLRLEDHSAALVIGDGPIGLLMVMLLAQMNIRELTMIGGRSLRLALARELGAKNVINYHDFGTQLLHGLRNTINGSFPNIIEASGSGMAMEICLALAARGGKILVLGEYGKAQADFPWNHLLHQELELIGSNASAQAWPEAVALAQKMHPMLSRLITHRFPARHFADAMALMKHNRDIVKVVLLWEHYRFFGWRR